MSGPGTTGSPPRADAQIDPGVETIVLGLLEERLEARDVARIQARVRALTVILGAVPEAARRALRARLVARAAGDRLAAAFHDRLHHATRRRLLRVLAGEVVPLPAAGDAMTQEGFAAHLPDDAVSVQPTPLVIHRRFAPSVTVRVSLHGDYGPPADEDPVVVVVRVFDPEGAEVGMDRGPWPMAQPQSGSAAFVLDRAGTYRVECEVIRDGLVIAERHGSAVVHAPAAESMAAAAAKAGGGLVGLFAALRVAHAADITAAMQLAPEQLRAEHERILDQLATETDPAARAQLADDRNLLEFAAATGPAPVDLSVEAPAADLTQVEPSAPLVSADSVVLYYTHGEDLEPFPLQVSADPRWIRRWIERAFATGVQTFWGATLSGNEGVDALEGEITAREPAAPDRGAARAARALIDGRILPELRRQVAAFKAEVKAFDDQFGRTAKEWVRATLDRSETVARGELSHYGIEVTTDTFTVHGPDDKPGHGHQTVTVTRVSGGENAAAREMAQAAAELAANQRALDRMRSRLEELEFYQGYLAYQQGFGGATFGGFAGAPSGAGAVRAEDLPELVNSLSRLVAQAEEAHQLKIEEDSNRFPVLASYKDVHDRKVDVDADGLGRLVDSRRRAQEIYDRISPVLHNIQRTRDGLESGDLNVWKESRVVQMTMAQLLIAPGSLRAAMVTHKVAEESEGSWTDWAIAALTFGLAILAAIPTGGSSLVAAVVVTAGIADTVTNIYLVADHIQRYQLQEAATATDLDAQARAVSVDHPSLLWLAFDIVASGVGLHGAFKTFGRVAEDLARAERVGMSAAEADEAAARVYALQREGTLSAEAAERAAGEIRQGVKVAGEAGGEAAEATASAVTRDLRLRVAPEHVAELERRLGVAVEIDESLETGVELSYRARPARFGGVPDIEPTAIRVGRDALIEDVLAHRKTIARITRYNGVVGKLRSLWDRMVVGAEGMRNPFRPGTLGWESWEEMSKLDELIALRRARWNPRVLDAQTLDDEIAFLEGRRSFHEEIVRNAEETGELPGLGHIGAPDIGKVTEEATSRGYRLPGAAENADPTWYYYRNKPGAPGEYELARRPSAPDHAPVYRAVSKDGRFEGLEPGETPGHRVLIPSTWDDPQVVAHLWSDASFQKFGQMLEDEGLATRAEIDRAIAASRGGRDAILHDTLRGKVKDVFRGKLVAKLTDPALDAGESYTQMRRMLDPLAVSDRGNLAEVWYKARYAERAEAHVAVRVARTGARAGEVERRTLDLVEGDEAVEVKDIVGGIDKDQFEAQVDMIEQQVRVGGADSQVVLRRMRYVFTKTEGARANLAFMAEKMEDPVLFRRLSVQVVDQSGVLHTVTTAKQARALLAKLGGPL